MKHQECIVQEVLIILYFPFYTLCLLFYDVFWSIFVFTYFINACCSVIQVRCYLYLTFGENWFKIFFQDNIYCNLSLKWSIHSNVVFIIHHSNVMVNEFACVTGKVDCNFGTWWLVRSTLDRPTPRYHIYLISILHVGISCGSEYCAV